MHLEIRSSQELVVSFAASQLICQRRRLIRSMWRRRSMRTTVPNADLPTLRRLRRMRSAATAANSLRCSRSHLHRIRCASVPTQTSATFDIFVLNELLQGASSKLLSCRHQVFHRFPFRKIICLTMGSSRDRYFFTNYLYRRISV